MFARHFVPNHIPKPNTIGIYIFRSNDLNDQNITDKREN